VAAGITSPTGRHADTKDQVVASRSEGTLNEGDQEKGGHRLRRSQKVKKFRIISQPKLKKRNKEINEQALFLFRKKNSTKETEEIWETPKMTMTLFTARWDQGGEGGNRALLGKLKKHCST